MLTLVALTTLDNACNIYIPMIRERPLLAGVYFLSYLLVVRWRTRRWGFKSRVVEFWGQSSGVVRAFGLVSRIDAQSSGRLRVRCILGPTNI